MIPKPHSEFILNYLLQGSVLKPYGGILKMYISADPKWYRYIRGGLQKNGYVLVCRNSNLSMSSKLDLLTVRYLIINDLRCSDKVVLVHEDDLATLDLLCFNRRLLFEKKVHEAYLRYINKLKKEMK